MVCTICDSSRASFYSGKLSRREMLGCIYRTFSFASFSSWSNFASTFASSCDRLASESTVSFYCSIIYTFYSSSFFFFPESENSLTDRSSPVSALFIFTGEVFSWTMTCCLWGFLLLVVLLFLLGDFYLKSLGSASLSCTIRLAILYCRCIEFYLYEPPCSRSAIVIVLDVRWLLCCRWWSGSAEWVDLLLRSVHGVTWFSDSAAFGDFTI